MTDQLQTAVSSPQKLLNDRLDQKWASVRKNLGAADTVIPRDLLGRAFQLHPLTAEGVWGLFPELLLGWSEPGYDHRSLLAFAGQSHDWLPRLQGILVCHSLNPTWESVALLAELGRASRASHGLQRPLRVMLAGTTWARFNWVVQDTGLEDNLSGNQSWRELLYGKLNAEVRICESNPPSTNLPNIAERALQYSLLAESIWGDDITRRRLENEETKELLATLELYSTLVPYRNVLELSVVKDALAPHLAVIQSAITNLHRLDRPTFLYFLLQYHYQAQYPHHLKIAIRRESDFDEPFAEIEKAFEHPEVYATQVYAYYADYYFAVSADTKQPLTVHPYYFPSGTLYQEIRLPSEARKLCIMIDDQQVEKIIGCLQAQKTLDRSRFLSDLLSLAHFLGLDHTPLRKTVRRHLKGFSQSCSESWERFAVESSLFAHRVRHWSALAFTRMSNDEVPPYYFLPYLWSSMGVTVENEATLVRDILADVRDIVGLPQVWVPPR